jgi:predicted nucleotidyltransferase
MSTQDTIDEIFDLEAAVKSLCGEFQQIDAVYIFGSRRYQTRSTRSDIDILLECNSHIKKSSLRDFIFKHRTALDLFVMENGRAESVANESFIAETDNEALISRLDAVELYRRGSGSSDFFAQYKKQSIDRRVQFKMTVLPGNSNEIYEVQALQKFFATANEHGLPSRPYIGVSTSEACDFLISVIRAIPLANRNVSNYGLARSGWTIKLATEYDFQNIFWITTKPWLPGLGREEVAIIYDGKEKKADFNLFGSQLLIEFKHVKDAGDVRETTKTLSGLTDFYQRHPNVRVLLFVILVDPAVVMDDLKIESDYSFDTQTPKVVTVVVRNN